MMVDWKQVLFWSLGCERRVPDDSGLGTKREYSGHISTKEINNA